MQQPLDSASLAKRNPPVVGKALFGIFTERTNRICVGTGRDLSEYKRIMNLNVSILSGLGLHFIYKHEIRYYTLKDRSRPVTTGLFMNFLIWKT